MSDNNHFQFQINCKSEYELTALLGLQETIVDAMKDTRSDFDDLVFDVTIGIDNDENNPSFLSMKNVTNEEF
jgi:hypothetical protein